MRSTPSNGTLQVRSGLNDMRHTASSSETAIFYFATEAKQTAAPDIGRLWIATNKEPTGSDHVALVRQEGSPC